MSYLNAFKKVFSKVDDAVFSGTVIRIGESSVQVSTVQGLKEFSSANPEQYTLGDFVTLQGTILVGKAPSEGTIPVYNV